MALWSSSCFLIRLAHFHSSYLGTICFHYCVSSLLQLYLWLPPTPLWQQQCLFSSHSGLYARLFRRSINLILLQVWTLDSLRQMCDELDTDPDVLLKKAASLRLYTRRSVGLHSSVYILTFDVTHESWMTLTCHTGLKVAADTWSSCIVRGTKPQTQS